MTILLALLASLMITLGGPIAIAAIARGRMKLGLSLVAGVAVSTMLLFPPKWLEPVVHPIWSLLI